MRLDQLRHNEQLVLIGLYHWVMHADGVVSPEETAALMDLRRRMRVPDWGDLLGEAQEVLPDVETLSLACRSLTRPAARQLIYEELVRLAAADEVDASEVELLNWLAVTWGFVTREEVERAKQEAQIGADDQTVEMRALSEEDLQALEDDDDAFDLFG